MTEKPITTQAPKGRVGVVRSKRPSAVGSVVSRISRGERPTRRQ